MLSEDNQNVDGQSGLIEELCCPRVVISVLLKSVYIAVC